MNNIIDLNSNNIRKVEKIIYFDHDSYTSRLLMRWIKLTGQKNVTFKEADSKTKAIRNTSSITVKVPVLKIKITYNDNSVKSEYFLGNVQKIADIIANVNLK